MTVGIEHLVPVMSSGKSALPRAKGNAKRIVIGCGTSRKRITSTA